MKFSHAFKFCGAVIRHNFENTAAECVVDGDANPVRFESKPAPATKTDAEGNPVEQAPHETATLQAMNYAAAAKAKAKEREAAEADDKIKAATDKAKAHAEAEAAKAKPLKGN